MAEKRTKLTKWQRAEIFKQMDALARQYAAKEPDDPRHAEIRKHLAALSRLISKNDKNSKKRG